MKANCSTPALLFVWAIPIIFIYSCTPYYGAPDPYLVDISRQKENIYYTPSAPNTPMLSEKNDFNFTLVRSSGEKFDGVAVQGAFLPTKHLGIISSYSFLENNGGGIDYMKNHQFEIGAGYVQQFSKELLFETYAGLGTGQVNNIHYTGHSHINQTSFFIQPTVSVNNEKKTVQFGFVSKFSGINFKVDTTFNTDRERFSNAQLTSLYNKPFHIMWEPGLVFRFGWKAILFHTGYSFSSDLTSSDLYRSKGNFSIGLSLRLNALMEEISN